MIPFLDQFLANYEILYLPLWMFVFLTFFMMLGYPVAFTLLGSSLIFGYLGYDLSYFNLLPYRIWGIMTNVTLIAVPLFVFMGVILEKSGLAARLLESMALLFGKIRGGLAISVVIVGALLGASTGIVGATVVTMGLLSIPTMLKQNYKQELVLGTIAASGTLGQIIPPSIILVLLGDILGVAVGDLFIGAIVPSLILVGAYILYIAANALLDPDSAPAMKQNEQIKVPLRNILSSVFPPLILIIAVLGSILGGLTTPTEAAAIGALGAIILVLIDGKLSLKILNDALHETTKLSSMVFIILVGATAFGLVFRSLGGDQMVKDFIFSFELNRWLILTLIMALVFVLGFFLDFIEISFIFIPILAPIMKDLEFSPLWFGILFAVNLQTSFMTPPFGFSLFYLKGVCPKNIKTGTIYKGIVPFVIIQLFVMGILSFFPELVEFF